MTPYDVIVVGAGPGGYVAAIRAAQLGLKTAIVEREHLGGICLNWGCIPTKALLRSAEVFNLVKQADEFGVSVNKPKADIVNMVKRSRKVSAKLNAGIDFLLSKAKVDVIWGEAKLVGNGKIKVSASTKQAVTPQNPVPKKTLGVGDYQAKNIILATGAKPRILPGLEPDGKIIWTYFEAMKPNKIPKDILVVGSGAIGIEFASFYSALGSEVTVVEAMERVLPAEDEEIAQLAKKQFESHGIKFIEGAFVTGVKTTANDGIATIKLKDGTSIEQNAEVIISAAGVVGNYENLGLEALGIKLEKGCVKTNAQGQSSVAGIWAIGDLAGAPMLAHKASHDAITCLDAITGKDTHAIVSSSIPRCTYSTPQMASVGLTEAQAKAKGMKINIGRFPYAANGKAIALGEMEGMIKTIFDLETGELIGAHMIGAEVTELISVLSLGMSLEATDEAFAQTIFPHPTLSESIHESVLASLKQAIHIP